MEIRMQSLIDLMTDNNNGDPDENRSLMDNLDKATAPILTY